MTRTRWLLGLLIVSLGGCSAAHHQDEDISSGLYELDVARDRDDCSPSRYTGRIGNVAVVSHDGLLNIPVPESEGALERHLTGRVSLAASEGFHYATDEAMASCGEGRVHREWTVIGSRDGTFEIDYLQRFEGMSACGGSVDLPASDCQSTRRLRFRMVSACEAPCEMRWAPGTDDPECACP